MTVRRGRHFFSVFQVKIFVVEIFSENWRLASSAWKVSVFKVFLVRILPHVDWKRRFTPYYLTLITWPHLQNNLRHVIKFCWWHKQKFWHHNLYFKIPKFADFELKNAPVSKTQGVCSVSHIIFGSSLGKV